MGQCIYTTFSEITQPFIKATLAKKDTIVLELIMFYETREDNPKKYFRVLGHFIYTIIKNYFCIDYLACQSKQLSEITVGYKEGSKHGDKTFNIILGIGIPDGLMNLMSFCGFLKNIHSYVVLKFY